MGAYQSKRKHFPAPKKRKLKKPVYDYMPNSSRKRPKSSQSWREVVMVTLGQMGKSSTSYNEFETEVEKEQHMPKWQSKWETDMRPTPVSENNVSLRDWKSMHLPTTTTEDSVAANKATPTTKPNNNKPVKRRLSRTRRYDTRKAVSPLPDVEETDNFDRYSWSSSKVDGLKMLHKSDDKTMSTLQQASRMWQIDNKKTTKTWFLGQDSHMKLDNQIVEKKARAVKSRNVFVAKKSKGRWAREAEVQF